MKHQIATALLALIFLAAALLAGEHRRGALAGAAIAGVTAVASVLAMGRAAVGPRPVRRTFLVLAVAFLVRLVLVAIGTLAIVRAGEAVVPFVVGFFVPYFVFSAIEAAFVHSLRHQAGRST